MFLKSRQVSSFGYFVFDICVLRASVFVFEYYPSFAGAARNLGTVNRKFQDGGLK